VYNHLEEPATIIFIKPEGSHVKKGDLVCELDSASLKDRLVNQEITTKGAEAKYLDSKLTREIAEMAVREYLEGTYRQGLQTANGEIMLAGSRLKRAEARLGRTRQARERLKETLRRKPGDVVAGEIVAELDLDDRIDDAEQALEREKLALERSQTKREVLESYTKERTIKELKSRVEQAYSDELAKQAMWTLEKSKEAKLRRQISFTSMKAPADGFLVHANPMGRQGPVSLEGALVRPRQKIFSVPDLTKPMQLNAKMPESMVDKIQPDMNVKVKVDAFPDEMLTGVVVDVAPRPDPGRMGDPVKVYTTHVKLDKAPSGLRPGMTASADVVLLKDVLTVPLKAVKHDEAHDQYHVMVKTPEGKIEPRDVTLGAGSIGFVQVKSGLKVGDVVVTDPAR
jgi:RND family efflux transporter MFP subunit